MNANPVLQPKLATPALVFASVAIIVCLICLVAAVGANLLPQWVSVALGAAFLLAAASDVAIWLARRRRVHSWMAGTQEKWKSFDEAKRRHGTTAEVTVLSVDALEPTGSWVTIKWNRFDHVQRAWIEALPEPIWPGTVLLIAPDPAQVMPGAPWPPVYFIRSAQYFSWAPAAGGRRPTTRCARQAR
jgi:hypothetical protein